MHFNSSNWWPLKRGIGDNYPLMHCHTQSYFSPPLVLETICMYCKIIRDHAYSFKKLVLKIYLYLKVNVSIKFCPQLVLVEAFYAIVGKSSRVGGAKWAEGGLSVVTHNKCYSFLPETGRAREKEGSCWGAKWCLLGRKGEGEKVSYVFLSASSRKA